MGPLNLVIRRLLRQPLQVCIADDFRRWRGITLYLGALLLARTIEKRTRAARIGIMLPTTGLFPMALLAIWLLRRTAVPLNFLLSRQELEFVIKDAGLDTVITAGPMIERFGEMPEGVHAILLDEMSFRRPPRPRRTPKQQPGDIAVLLYTSGTTANPKGVPLTAGNLAANVGQCLEWGEIRDTDSFLGVLPQFHSFGLTVLTLLPLIRGIPVYCTAQFVPSRVRALIRERRPTAFVGVPAMFNALLRDAGGGPEDYRSIRIMIAGGEPLDADLRERFRERFSVPIQEGYGLTETSPVLNWLRPEDGHPGSVGRALPGIEQVILDTEGNRLDPGEEGEICVRGPNVFGGYFNRPEETAKAFDAGGFFHTGDLGYLDEDGFLYITGRRTDLIIVAGENVFPREIETVLNAHPSVAASGVIGVRDANRGQVPIAFVETVDGEAFDAGALRAHCRQLLARYKVPRSIRAVEELPRGPTGKVMRRHLLALLDEGPVPTPTIDPEE